MDSFMPCLVVFILFAATGTATGCEIVQAAKCLMILNNMGGVDTATLCRKVAQAKECTEESVQGCEEEQREHMMLTFTDFDSICDGSGTGCQIDEAAACMMKLSNINMTEITEICSVTRQAKTCAEEKLKDCSEEQKGPLMAGFVTFDEICAESGTGCQIAEAAACMMKLSNMNINMTDITEICSVTRQAKTCAEEKLNNCSEEQKGPLMAGFVTFDGTCGDSDNSCSVLKVYECQNKIVPYLPTITANMTAEDMAQLCRISPEVRTCMKALESNCNDSVNKMSILEAFKPIDIMLANCDPGNPCSMVEMKKCLVGLPKSLEVVQNNMEKICLTLPETQSCIKKLLRCENKDWKKNIQNIYNGVTTMKQKCNNCMRTAGFSLITLVLTSITAKLII